MRRRITASLALVSLVVASASPVLAERRWFMAGTLDDYDEEASTIEVADRTILLTGETTIKNQDGTIGDWADIEARDGDHVEMLVTAGSPHPVAWTIRLVDPVEDESRSGLGGRGPERCQASMLCASGSSGQYR